LPRLWRNCRLCVKSAFEVIRYSLPESLLPPSHAHVFSTHLFCRASSAKRADFCPLVRVHCSSSLLAVEKARAGGLGTTRPRPAPTTDFYSLDHHVAWHFCGWSSDSFRLRYSTSWVLCFGAKMAAPSCISHHTCCRWAQGKRNNISHRLVIEVILCACLGVTNFDLRGLPSLFKPLLDRLPPPWPKSLQNFNICHKFMYF